MKGAEVKQRGGGIGPALVIFAVAPGTPIPGLRALHPPAFPHRQEAGGPFWPPLPLAPPARAMRGEPVCEGRVVRFASGEEGLQAGKVVNWDLLEQLHRRATIVPMGTRNQYGEPHTQRLYESMPLAPFALLPALIAAFRAPPFRGLHRLTC
jgi:hypothetical protein